MLHARFRSSCLVCRIDASALAAVFTVLATSLLLLQSVTFTFHDGVSAQLPRVRNAIALWGAQREDAWLITIYRDGQLFLDGQRVAPEELTFGLRARLRHGAPGKVYIRADGRARYSAVASVLDGIHSAGLTHIVFLTEQSR